ncbi:hypothetical protein Afil01_23210 [Actinorhabdospora filicis]|uniref:ATP-binding protein n=1 Tax=Actinorhabdospora filicis TaxID=1785913 RepID=A0A9W6SKT5_9ACTN|nr:ATP-binding protein [Actinorhabdospora filicis]GLZ77514.1 hypothetical protein Afil01_23210 [Actinorhabdospora filicis]
MTAVVLTTIPRLAAGPGDVRAGRSMRLAAVVAAYHRALATGEAFTLGWRRMRPGGDVDVIISGVESTPADEGVRVSYPPGAAGRKADLNAFFGVVPAWTHLEIVTEQLGVVPGAAPEQAAPDLHLGLLSAWTGPFAWYVTATPVAPSTVDELAAGAQNRLRSARANTTMADAVLAAEREEALHRQLSTAGAAGMWELRVSAGAASTVESAQVAGLLAVSTDLAGLPYALRPSSTASPAVATSELLAALAAVPAIEVPGVRLVTPPMFDVTPETRGREGVDVGAVLDAALSPGEALRLPFGSLNRHAFVTGATGGGKSQTTRHLLEQATGAGLTWLVIEPAKAEYRAMAARVDDDVLVVRPGDLASIPAGLNPLEPEPGFPLQTHADLLKALFLATFDGDEPFPQVLAAALARVYESTFDMVLSEPLRVGASPRWPDLGDLQSAADAVVQTLGYGKEISDNVRGFIKVRLSSLRLGTAGRFLDGGHAIDFGELLRHNVVIELEDIGDDRDKAFLMGTVLIRLIEHLRMNPAPRGVLRHLTVIEEAHRLLRKPEGGGAAARAVEMFADMLAEVRAYGEGLVVADQIPAKLVPDVIKNTAVKFLHRLPAEEDRLAVGATMNLTPEQSEYVVSLSPGRAAVFADGMDRPILVQMPDGSASELSGTAHVPPDALVPGRPAGCATGCACTLRDITLARRLVADPRVTAWAEHMLRAHLTPRPTPLPGPAMLAELAADPRTSCAIAHAVEDALAARRTLLDRPGPLGAHLASVMRAQLTGADPCALAETTWAAPPGTSREAIDFGTRSPSGIERATGLTRHDPGVGGALRALNAHFTRGPWST